MERSKTDVMQDDAQTQAQYKDRLFKDIFSDKTRLLSLYNSLNSSNYTDVDDLEMTTIENIIYITMRNDISFLISDQMCLYEQQSSYNSNMPLRGLMYFAELYQMYLTRLGKDLYSSKLVKVPTPKYVVFYNGVYKSNVPDMVKLRLSDAFIKKVEPGDFEWTATMLNINEGHNKELLEKCEALGAYSTFVAQVRKNLAEGQDRDKAIGNAVDDAIKRNLLGGYFKEKKMEVLNMSLKEFDREEYDRNRREEGREEGMKEGMEKGMEKGMEEGRILTARAMINRHLDIALIADCTGLTEDEVAALDRDADAQAIQ